MLSTPTKSTPSRGLRRRGTAKAALALACAALLAGPAGLARAQDAYPSKPIRVVVPFAPGGGGDTLARLVLGRAGAELGQPLVFENLAGAGGNVGSTNAARAAADGYTVLYGTNGTLAINHSLYKNPGFDPLKSFQPVSRLTQIGLVVVVRSGLPAKTMPELLQLLKANPGKYTFGSAGNGTSSHLAAEMLKSQTGVEAVHIPYRGGATAMTDLIGGQIDMMIEVMPNATPHIRSGRIRALAVTTAKRSDAFPELPTVAESGVGGYEVTAWDAVMLPAGTPAQVVARWNAAVRAALTDPEIVKQLGARGTEPVPSSPDELGRFLRSELTRWGAAVKQSGASVD
jgi:tripartite-type tricarboxylate transporter receptor subunit TctC